MKAIKRHRAFFTSRLMAESNIFSAIGSILDIGGSSPLYNYSETSADSDRDALSSDWEMTGHDIRLAMKKNIH